MRPCRSEAGPAGVRFPVFALFAILTFAVPQLFAITATVVTTDIFIVGEEQPIDEDVYVAASSGRIEGRIDGDLVITTGDLTISGTVTGSVTALSSARVLVTADGSVEGSVRALSAQVTVEGAVGGDLFATAAATTVAASGRIARDVIVFGGTANIVGSVGRDVRGRVINSSVQGNVGRDVDLAVDVLTIGADAQIGGDVLYRSSNEASISSAADIGGQVVQLPAQSNFLFGVILTIANVVGSLAFLVAGIFILWLLRGTSARAVGMVTRHPLKTFLVGLAALILGPILVLLLAFTLVGLPVAAILLFGMLVALVFGPVPAVTALGDRLLRGRGGLFGAFVVGAILWRLGIWLIPFVGAVLFLVGLVWGVGAWLMAGWQQRRAPSTGGDLMPAALRRRGTEPPEDWEFPLPPAEVEPGSGDSVEF